MPSRLVLALFALLLLSQASLASAVGPPAFEDSFEGEALNRYWQLQDPSGQSGFSHEDGVLLIHVASGSDQWVGVDRAPRMLKPQPGAPYSIEMEVLWSDQHPNSFAGLTIFRDPGNWLLGGWLGNGTLEFSGVINNRPTGVIGTSATHYSWLRVRKAKSNLFVGFESYYFDASADGVNWTNINVFHDPYGFLHHPTTRVGFLAKDWSGHGGYGYSVALGHYREYQGDRLPSALAEYSSRPATVQIAKLTGPGSPLNGALSLTANVCGTDLGIPFVWQNKTYLAFGDTKGCEGQASYKSNTVAFTPTNTPYHGLTFGGWIADGNAQAKELVPTTAGITTIPTGAVAVGPTAYLFFMEVRSWDAPGRWSCNYTTVASADASNPDLWTRHYPSVAWGPGNFSQLAVLRDASTYPATLYIYGVPCGRFGSVMLMRVPETHILQQSAYTYFVGFDAASQPLWSLSPAHAATVAGGPAGELSVRYNAWLGRYVMTYYDPHKNAIVIRESPKPWGPWAAPVLIASGIDFPRAYGPFMHSDFDENGGETIYYTLSQWDPYNVFWMRTTLMRNPILP
jgi:hypothetical protein